MESGMTVQFWGVRGSIPCPDPLTMRYGGNTSCVSIEVENGTTLVLDAGSGIRGLGKALLNRPGDILVLVSHRHWDHIQGFPFFDPLYEPGRRIFVFPSIIMGPQAPCSLIKQMDGAHFPVTPDRLPSQWTYVTEQQEEVLHDHGFSVSRLAVNHPGGCMGFRIEYGGRSVVYIPDNELDPPYEEVATFEDIALFCREADVLIHDAMYVLEDMPQKRGWGHSVVGQVCELALAAEVRHLVLFHHDPDRTDDQLDVIHGNARSWLQKRGAATECTVAFEGMELVL